MFNKQIRSLEASLKATLARLSTSLSLSVFGSNLDQNQSHVASDDGNGESSMIGRAALDVASVRLVDVPEKARRLFNLLDQVSETNICAFPFSVLSLSLTHTHFVFLNMTAKTPSTRR